jgi:protease-4
MGADGIKTTPLSGEPDLLRGPSPDASRLIQASVESIYRTFLGVVAQSRHKSPADVDKIAQGRIWDGGTAHQLGLVDGFGGLTEAIAKAGDLAKLAKDDRDVRYLERPTSFREGLLETLASQDRDDDSAAPADGFAAIGGRPELELAAMIADLRSILTGPRIQARCLECGPVAPAVLTKQDKGFLAALAEWF